jgi:selenocysteine-specific elongation factor
VLDPRARRSRRGRLTLLLGGDLDERALLSEVLGTRRLWSLADLAARLQQPAERVSADLRALQEQGQAVVVGEVAAAAEQWAALQAGAERTLSAYHVAQPLRAGMPREELRERLGAAPALWPAVLAELVRGGVLAEEGALVRLPAFRPQLSPGQRRRAEEILQGLAMGGFSPPGLPELAGDRPEDATLLAYLVEQGELVRLNEQVAYPRRVYQEMVERVVAGLEQGPLTVAQVRDLLGVSRRYALALLEYLDLRRITRRSGDERTLLRRPDWLPAQRPAS